MKKFIDFFIYFLLIFIIFDSVVYRHILGFGLENYDTYNGSYSRISVPYFGFMQKRMMYGSSSYDNINFFDMKDKEAIRVAFFGGSTGEIIKETDLLISLSKKFKHKVQVKNFSCSSANHRQHLHMILELLPKYNPDIVIFYGAANELIQPFFLDPRPGYPYNAYYKTDTSAINQVLIENSSVISSLEKSYGTITPFKKLKMEYKPGSEKFSRKLIDKYFETILLSKNITETLNSNVYGHTKFIAFYQPIKIENIPDYGEEFRQINQEIREKIKNIDYISDVSNAYDGLDNVFQPNDYCHVNEEANKHIVEVMSDIVAKKFPIKK